VLKFTVTFDKSAFERDLRKLRTDVVPKVMARALNRTADGVKAEAVRTISKLTSLKQSEIRARMWVKGATPQRWWAEVGALPYAPNLKKFRATRTKAGVRANAWGTSKVYRGSFVTPKGAVVARTGKRREPLKPLYGPSLRKTFMKDVVLKRLEAVANQRWRSEFERELARRLRYAR
jgi:hypothetical protein